MQRPWRNEPNWSCCCPLRVYFGFGPKSIDSVTRKQKLKIQSIFTATTILDGLQTVLSEKQTKPFGFLPAAQDDWKWEFFMSDFEWTASAESGSDRHIMLLDMVENWQQGCFLGKGLK